MSTPWRIAITATAETRAGAEDLARTLLRWAERAPADGDAVTTPDGLTCAGTLECGDPGLAHRPQDVDLTVVGGWEALEADRAKEQAAESLIAEVRKAIKALHIATPPREFTARAVAAALVKYDKALAAAARAQGGSA